MRGDGERTKYIDDDCDPLADAAPATKSAVTMRMASGP